MNEESWIIIEVNLDLHIATNSILTGSHGPWDSNGVEKKKEKMKLNSHIDLNTNLLSPLSPSPFCFLPNTGVWGVDERPVLRIWSFRKFVILKLQTYNQPLIFILIDRLTAIVRGSTSITVRPPRCRKLKKKMQLKKNHIKGQKFPPPAFFPSLNAHPIDLCGYSTTHYECICRQLKWWICSFWCYQMLNQGNRIPMLILHQ